MFKTRGIKYLIHVIFKKLSITRNNIKWKPKSDKLDY